MKKKILITGASSFLGKTLVDAISELHEITLLKHHKSLKTTEKGEIKIVHGGLENISAWETSLSKIDVIIHLAGITHSKDANQYEKINTDGTCSLIEAGVKHGIKQFIFISTRAIGECCGAYGNSKKLAEKYLKKSRLVYTILRVAEAYDENFTTTEGFGNLVNLIKKNLIVPCPANKNVTLAPIHKDDVRDCIIATVNNPLTYFKTYTLAGPENLSLKEVATRIAKYQKLKRLFIPIPIFLFKFAFFIFSSLLGISASDQLNRLLCKKNPLSNYVATDLKVSPRKFLRI
jgi:NADH dehydrogenase